MVDSWPTRSALWHLALHLRLPKFPELSHEDQGLFLSVEPLANKQSKFSSGLATSLVQSGWGSGFAVESKYGRKDVLAKVHRFSLINGSPTEFGVYKSEDRPGFALRTLKGLWLTPIEVDSSRKEIDFCLHPDWRNAAIFSVNDFRDESQPDVEIRALCFDKFVRKGHSQNWDVISYLLTLESGAVKLTEAAKATSDGQDYYTVPSLAELRPLALKTSVTAINSKDVAKAAESDEDAAFAEILEFDAILKEKLALGFPIHPGVSPFWSLSKERDSALKDVVANLITQGVDVDFHYFLDFRTIEKHHLSRAALEMESRTEHHNYVLELLSHFLDIREHLDNYIRDAKTFIQSTFSLQDNVIERAFTSLKIENVEAERSDFDAAGTLLNLFVSALYVGGVFAKPMGVIAVIFDFASQFTQEAHAAGNQIKAARSGGLERGKVTLLEHIKQSFLDTSDALDDVGGIIGSTAEMLLHWRGLNAIWSRDTENLQKEVEGLFEDYVWKNLVPRAVRLKWKTTHTLKTVGTDFASKGDETEHWASAQRQRLADLTLIGVQVIASNTYYTNQGRSSHIGYEVQYRMARLSLAEAGIDPVVMKKLTTEFGYTPRTLMELCGFKEEFSNPKNYVRACRLTGEEITEIQQKQAFESRRA